MPRCAKGNQKEAIQTSFKNNSSCSSRGKEIKTKMVRVKAVQVEYEMKMVGMSTSIDYPFSLIMVPYRFAISNV